MSAGKNLKIAYAYDADSKLDEHSLPWHRTGDAVKPGTSMREMMEIVGNDFEIIKKKEYTIVDGEYVWTGKYSLIRNNMPPNGTCAADKIITPSVGEIYKPTQPIVMADFIENFCDEAGGSVESTTTGEFNNGAIIWAAVRIKKAMKLFRGRDVTEPYLMFLLRNQYGQSSSISLTAVRAVCQNTVQAALAEANKDYQVKFSHRKDFNADQAAKILGLANQRIEELNLLNQFLSERQFKKAQLKKFFSAVFPSESSEQDKLSKMATKALDEVMDTQPGANFGAGTWYQAFNCVTYMVDHVVGNDANVRQMRAWVGPGAELKRKAMNLAKEFADA